MAICEACLAELFDPADRRYLYPFITCTHCGPRFTVTRRLPYDRATTSLAEFPLCDACAAEYADPADRRFHAETTCCPACGPRLDTPLDEIGARIRAGEIVALKGLGGFHLVCDARREDTVERLRARKRRDGKPFAVMVTNLCDRLAASRRSTTISARLLAGRERPIVIVPARDEARLAPGVSNGLPSVGLFLPYTPLHWLVIWELLGRPAGLDWMSDGERSRAGRDLGQRRRRTDRDRRHRCAQPPRRHRRCGRRSRSSDRDARRRQRGPRRGRRAGLRAPRARLHAGADPAGARGADASPHWGPSSRQRSR